jgi:thiamine-phosphate pyrophosphorylase
MIIPKLHYISQGNTPKEVLENIQKACTSGTELVQLRLPEISEDAFLALAKEAREITMHFQTRLIINGYYKIAKEIKADGVHLETKDICPIIARTHLYTWQIIGSTANTLQDCEILLEKQVDYILLSPFRAGTNKESSTPILGIDGFKLLIEALQTETPIMGFGGITTSDVINILTIGISGIAVSDAITKNFDSIKTFHELLKASATKEMRHRF